MKGLEQKAKKKAVPKKYVAPWKSESQLSVLPELTPRLVLPLQAQTSLRRSNLYYYYYSSSLWLEPESEIKTQIV
jgi:hypothetical protein